jgi:hypothetical protein
MKDLMSGGLAKLNESEEAQKGMQKGFDLLAGKSIGPTEVCNCEGYDQNKVPVDPYSDEPWYGPPSPTDQATCEAAGGTWVCKTIQNFNLRDQMAELGSLTDPNAFAFKVAEIKDRFANTVPNLGEQFSAVNEKLGDFFNNFQMPSLPKAGDKVTTCNCVGGFGLATNESECLAEGGTWVCEEKVLEEDMAESLGGITSLFGGAPGGLFSGPPKVDQIAKATGGDTESSAPVGGGGGLFGKLSGLLGGGAGGGKSSFINDFAAKIPGGSEAVQNFFAAASNGIPDVDEYGCKVGYEQWDEENLTCAPIQLPDNLGSVQDLFGDSIDKLKGLSTGKVQANGAINFGAGGGFQMPNLFDKIPTAGEEVDICQCKNFNPALVDDIAFGLNDKASCLAAGGQWVCEKGPAPDLTSIFGSSGLPKFDKDLVCKVCENVDVKNDVITDPDTGRTSIKQIKQIVPEVPKVAQEPPAEPKKPPVPLDTETLIFRAKANAFFESFSEIRRFYFKILIQKKRKLGAKLVDMHRYYFFNRWAREVNGNVNIIYRELYATGEGYKTEQEAVNGYNEYWGANPEAKAEPKNAGKVVYPATIDTIPERQRTKFYDLVKKQFDSVKGTSKYQEVQKASFDEVLKVAYQYIVKQDQKTKAANLKPPVVEDSAVLDKADDDILNDPVKTPDPRTVPAVKDTFDADKAKKEEQEKKLAAETAKNGKATTTISIFGLPTPIEYDPTVFEAKPADYWRHISTGKHVQFKPYNQNEYNEFEKAAKSKTKWEFTRLERGTQIKFVFDGSTITLEAASSGKSGEECVFVGYGKHKYEVCFDTSIWEYDRNWGAFIHKETNGSYDVNESKDLVGIARAIRLNSQYRWQTYDDRSGGWKQWLYKDGGADAERITPLRQWD